MAKQSTAEGAKSLAEKLVDGIIAEADGDTLEQARAMGLVLSMFMPQIEAARKAYNTGTDKGIDGRDDIFENAVTRKLMGYHT
ncbi:MAG TPA: hypothetical protein VM054_01445 [bacterium]|nr:hypothetical protein [bacterium]